MAALALGNYRRLIIKVGSSLLVDDNGELDRAWLDTLAHDLAALQKDKHELIVVSSGAIIPALAPASILMLQMVIRASMESSRTASPQYSSTWPAPPAVPSVPIIFSTISLEKM